VALELERVTDRAGAEAFHVLKAATIPYDHPGRVAEPLEGLVGLIENPLPSFTASIYLGRDAGRVVACAFLGLPQAENTHAGHVHVRIARADRRRGHGIEVAGFLLDQLRSAGRTQAIWHTGAPLDGTSPGESLSRRLGGTEGLVSFRRELRLGDLDPTALEGRLAVLLAGPASAYELRSWTGACPDELVDAAAEILPRVMSDSPRGDLDLADEVWDRARYREYEEMNAVRQRTSLVTVALDGTSGRLVAFTELNFATQDPRVVAQQGTVVLPEHRGRRLGLAVKLANTLQLLAGHPDARTVFTSNADGNEHMVAVNEALGFRVIERQTVWQLTLEPT
jgi:RimJ/RimL family protein N-acetyltransferase